MPRIGTYPNMPDIEGVEVLSEGSGLSAEDIVVTPGQALARRVFPDLFVNVAQPMNDPVGLSCDRNYNFSHLSTDVEIRRGQDAYRL